MSRAVRRLTIDYQLLWIPLELILFGMLTLMDWRWLSSVRGTSVVQWFVPVFSVIPGMFFMPKMPIWRALPVSASDRRRALWWLWIGFPLIRVILCMALSLAILAPLHDMHATPAQIAGLLELQMIAVLPMGAIFSAVGVLRRQFGLAAGNILTIPVFAVGVAFSALQLNGRTELVLGAALVAIGIAASHLWTDRIATATTRFSDMPATSARPESKGGGARGWAALLTYALGAVVVATAVALVIDYSMAKLIGADNFAGGARRVLPGQMIMIVVVISAVGGQAAPYAVRALRALPVGPLVLTAVLQSFMLGLTMIPSAVLWAAMWAMHLDTSQMPVYLAALIPVVALRLPINFRVGIQVGMFVTLVPVIGVFFLPFAPWAHATWFLAAMVLAAGLVWTWTWWELTRGRSAYRVAPMGLTRWRGGLN